VQARLDGQRAGILAAAVELLAEYGYAGCSMAAVAARAGIATGTVYKHFPGKADLAVELFRTVVGREVRAVEEAMVLPGGSATERMVAFVETFAGRALKSPRLAYALLAEPVDPAVEAERLVFRRTFRDAAAKQIAEGVRTGALAPQDPETAAAALIGAVGEVLVGPLADGRPHPDVVPTLVTFALRALGGSDAGNT
jgi:AcrR family transcriptional regulator